jgi:hypothetical protein
VAFKNAIFIKRLFNSPKSEEEEEEPEPEAFLRCSTR